MYGQFPVNSRFPVLFLSQLPITGVRKITVIFYSVSHMKMSHVRNCMDAQYLYYLKPWPVSCIMYTFKQTRSKYIMYSNLNLKHYPVEIKV